MEFEQTDDRFGDEAGDADARGGAEPGEDILAGVSEAADHADGVVRHVVTEKSPVDEGLEVAVHERLDVGVVVVRQDERCKFAKISGRGGRTVDAFDYRRIGRVELRLEILRDRGGNLSLDIIGEEQFAQSGSAALVAENETAAVDLALDALAVVEAGVGTGAEDGYDAAPVSAGRAGSSHQVVLDIDFAHVGNFADYGGQGAPDFVRHNPGGVHIEAVKLPEVFLHKSLLQNLPDFREFHGRNVHARAEKPPVGAYYAPVALGGAAFY